MTTCGILVEQCLNRQKGFFVKAIHFRYKRGSLCLGQPKTPHTKTDQLSDSGHLGLRTTWDNLNPTLFTSFLYNTTCIGVCKWRVDVVTIVLLVAILFEVMRNNKLLPSWFYSEPPFSSSSCSTAVPSKSAYVTVKLQSSTKFRNGN